MLAAVAEMERDLLIERTQAGLARAEAEGKTLGRPASTTEEQRAAMAKRYQARDYGISRASVMRIVKPTPLGISTYSAPDGKIGRSDRGKKTA